MNPVPPETEFPLHWVDGFVVEIKPHIFLREADDLLILLPNQSYKLNKPGRVLLSSMLQGRTLSEALGGREPPPNVRRDLFHFFTGLAAMVKGCLGEGRGRPEVETVTYHRPYHSLLILSEVALTYRCNLACRFCYAGQYRDGKASPQPSRSNGGGGLSQGMGSPDDMSTDQVKRVLRVIRNDAQVPSVSFTGGEPTLREDLAELVAEAAALGLRVNLISNGQRMTPELAERLSAAGLSSAQISLEGPDSETHEKLTGVEGSFEATLRAVRALQGAKIPVHTNTTLTGVNVDAAVRMPGFAKDLGIDRFSMNMVIPAPWLREQQAELLLSYREIGPRILEVRKQARAAGIRFMWYSPTPYCLFNPIAHNLGNKGCAACDGLLSVDPHGCIIPCSSYFEPQGSLLETPFAEVWANASAREIREKKCAPQECRGCADFELCEGACPLYWQTMGCGELAQP